MRKRRLPAGECSYCDYTFRMVAEGTTPDSYSYHEKHKDCKAQEEFGRPSEEHCTCSVCFRPNEPHPQ